MSETTFDSDSHEKLGEGILEIERARQREKQLRIETEGLLEGLEALTKSHTTEEVFYNLVEVLGKYVPFKNAFLLMVEHENLKPIYSTSAIFNTITLPLTRLFKRVLAGHIGSVFDITLSEDWQGLQRGIYKTAKSVILCPLSSGKNETLLVVVHPLPAFFNKDHVRLFERFSPLTRILADRTSADIQRQLADTKIREQASYLDKANDAIIVHDLDNLILYWNKGAERLYGWSADEAIGRYVDTLLSQDRAQFKHCMERVLANGECISEMMERCKGGKELPVEGHWTLMLNEQGKPHRIFALKTDISKRKAAENEINYLAFYDSLTQLPNRQFLSRQLDQILLKGIVEPYSCALLFIDLDNFKTLNDTLGHDTGDLLLQQVASRLRSSVRKSDMVARLGGDEFVVLMEGIGRTEAEALSVAKSTAEQILANLNAPYTFLRSLHYSSPSIGITLFCGRDSAREVLKRADVAMYEAKAAGRNTIKFFNPSMQEKVSQRAAIEDELRNCLSQHQLKLMYQPFIGPDGLLAGVEALLRWEHPEKGLVMPGAFIPIAEETGHIVEIGRWVIDMACQKIAEWADDIDLCDLQIAVNVSARQFHQATFTQEVLDTLAKYSTPAHKLRLELTESLLLDNADQTLHKMRELRAAGITFSLDDFGTGYSSLAYLKRLPFDVLKIDRSFIRDILSNPNDAAIARTIITLADNLGMSVIAEGVETEQQRMKLVNMGCLGYQGYLISKPLWTNDLTEFVRSFPLSKHH